MTYEASTFPTPASDNPVTPILPGPDANPLPATPPDPIPGLEPIAPSLASPDPGVFHHEVPPSPEYEQTMNAKKPDLIN